MEQTPERRMLADGEMDCHGNGCPKIELVGDWVEVQGFEVDLTTPDGERRVRIPRAMLHAAARADR